MAETWKERRQEIWNEVKLVRGGITYLSCWTRGGEFEGECTVRAGEEEWMVTLMQLGSCL